MLIVWFEERPFILAQLGRVLLELGPFDPLSRVIGVHDPDRLAEDDDDLRRDVLR